MYPIPKVFNFLVLIIFLPETLFIKIIKTNNPILIFTLFLFALYIEVGISSSVCPISHIKKFVLSLHRLC